MFDLNGSMRDCSATERRSAFLAGPVFVLVTALPVGLRMGQVWTQPDTEHYLGMAAGHPAMLPFASRQLGPLLVRGLTFILPMSIQSAFLLITFASLLFFAGTVFYLLVRSGAPGFFVPAIAGLFLWTVQVNGLVLPDLLHAGLLCGFLLLLRAERLVFAGLMLFPLMLCRESTVLVLVCYLLAAGRRMRRREAVAALIAAGAGLVAVGRLAGSASGNAEQISPALYLLAKMPWNLLKNVLGLSVWANLNQTCGVPQWQVPVHLGPLHAVGFCGFVPEAPIGMIACALASFGLLPWLAVKAPSRTGFVQRELLVRFCLLYGALSFFLAPLLGATFLRLFQYGWPLFLVALPRLFGTGQTSFRTQRDVAVFVALHLLVSWSAWSFFRVPLVPPRDLLLVALGSLLGWLLLRQNWIPALPQVEEQRGNEPLRVL